MKKKVLIWVLAAVLVLSMAGCAAGAVSSNDKYVGMEPTAAAEAAAAETKDTTSISDLIRVPFGYLLDWLYTFTNSYGLALILFSLIVKLVLLPMSVKSKKSMLKMSRLSPQVKALEAKYGDDKQKYQLAVQQMYKEEGVSMGGGCLWLHLRGHRRLPAGQRRKSRQKRVLCPAGRRRSYRRLCGQAPRSAPEHYGLGCEDQSAGHELPVPWH